MALIDTLRGITATEDDDYFSNSTLVYYINQGQLQVISLATQKEKLGDISFRALDDLRSTQTTNPSGFSAVGDYFEGTDSLPNDFFDWLYLQYNDTPLKKLPVNQQYLLKHGNAIPNSDEGYFSLGNANVKLFIHEDPDGATDELDLNYIAKPTDIVEADTNFAELPDQLIGAVLYRAATLLGMQEGRGDVKNFQEMFNLELQSNLY